MFYIIIIESLNRKHFLDKKDKNSSIFDKILLQIWKTEHKKAILQKMKKYSN